MPATDINKLPEVVNRLELKIDHTDENLSYLRTDLADFRRHTDEMHTQLTRSLSDIQTQVTSNRRWSMQVWYGIAIVLIAVSSVVFNILTLIRR